MSRINKVLVYENWTGMIPNKIGTLYVDEPKGKEIMSFEYDENWLLSADDKNQPPHDDYYAEDQREYEDTYYN